MKTRLARTLTLILALAAVTATATLADDAAIKKRFVGFWKSPEGDVWHLTEDGIMLSSHDPAIQWTWTVADGVFQCSSKGPTGSTEISFKIVSVTKSKFLLKDQAHGKHTGTWTRVKGRY